MLNPKLDKNNLSNEECKIYARHLILNKIGVNGQKRLKKAKVLCVGAGGLGCPAILYLALAGIGCIGIIDPDTVSKSNLHRQILYNNQDINILKTISAKQKIAQINPMCNIQVYSYELNASNAHQIIQQYDIVLDASDNFETRYIIDSISYALHKIHIYGAIEGFEGHVSVFNYKSGPKYSDIYPKTLNLKNNTCMNIGVLGVLTGTIGILQATETLKIIIGVGEILSGYILIYNALNTSFKKMKTHIIKHKIQHLPNNKHITYQENTIASIQLKEKIIAENCMSIALIDVRQQIEYRHGHIPNAINIPLKTIEHKYNLNLILQQLQNKTIIIYCSDNSRSIIASNILKKYKIQHLRLYNGLRDWKNIIDK